MPINRGPCCFWSVVQGLPSMKGFSCTWKWTFVIKILSDNHYCEFLAMCTVRMSFSHRQSSSAFSPHRRGEGNISFICAQIAQELLGGSRTLRYAKSNKSVTNGPIWFYSYEVPGVGKNQTGTRIAVDRGQGEGRIGSLMQWARSFSLEGEKILRWMDGKCLLHINVKWMRLASAGTALWVHLSFIHILPN